MVDLVEFNVLGIEIAKPSRKQVGEKVAEDFLGKEDWGG